MDGEEIRPACIYYSTLSIMWGGLKMFDSGQRGVPSDKNTSQHEHLAERGPTAANNLSEGCLGKEGLMKTKSSRKPDPVHLGAKALTVQLFLFRHRSTSTLRNLSFISPGAVTWRGAARCPHEFEGLCVDGVPRFRS